MTVGTAGFDFIDLDPVQETFLDAALDGLSRPLKRIPCRFLYDARGSELFERICELPEYYPTRTELGILGAHAREMAALIGPDCELVEFGSGASRKVRLLLDALERPRGYVAIDISRDHLRAAAASIARDYPALRVTAVAADYMQPLPLPRAEGPRVGFFPGSTIGNLGHGEARRFLAHWARELAGGGMLVGVDLKKDESVLNAAYNDAAGVTAEFNLNLLARMNRELGADFDLDGFRHHAFYCHDRGRIEIYMESLRAQEASLGGRRFRFAEGELVHTENSHKFTIEEFRTLAAGAGFRPAAVWTDPARLFSVHYLAA
ncbi:MAG: L-histidine N(alpha)-methyltransferase [Alphaproteobacteria bacterium]|nr:L-histidine N(alpha)-methyltransferase [Alphaproteobacteria bacterium]